MLAQRHLGVWRGAGAEQVAVMVVRRGTGEVLASVGSNDYRDRHSGALDFSLRHALAGQHAQAVHLCAGAGARASQPASDVMADLPEGASGINNADGHFLGPMLPRQALANSRNVPATNLLRSVGLETTFRFLRDLGVHDVEAPADSFGLSMAIGSLPTSLDRLMRAYGALADDGRLSDLVWFEGQQGSPARVLSVDTARLITSFLADPMARLPSFPRYGPTEYPFPVALKTGTSQGYRDAWTIAWSEKYLVGVWLGRGDAGTMSQLSGASSAGRLAHALMLKLHNARPGDLDDASFPPPPGRIPVELCVFGGRRSAGSCGQTLTEWLKPEEVPPVEDAPFMRPTVETEQQAIVIRRRIAPGPGCRLSRGRRAHRPDGAVRLTIASPENNSRIWSNPDTPARAQSHRAQDRGRAARAAGRVVRGRRALCGERSRTSRCSGRSSPARIRSRCGFRCSRAPRRSSALWWSRRAPAKMAATPADDPPTSSKDCR